MNYSISPGASPIRIKTRISVPRKQVSTNYQNDVTTKWLAEGRLMITLI